MNDLARSILRTIAYARVTGSAMTAATLYRMLWCPPQPHPSFEDFFLELDRMGVKLSTGYVVCNERDHEAAERMRRAAIPTELMIERAQRALKLVSWVPFLESVIVCNSVGAEQTREYSDIDWLVITSPGRIWVVRAFLNAVLKLAGWRTDNGHEAGRICLSFFIDRNHLDLSPYRVVDDDIHFAYWIQQMIPLYGTNRATDFLQANAWITHYVPEMCRQYMRTSSVRVSFVARVVQRCMEKIFSWGGTWFESCLQVWQYQHLRGSLKEKAHRNDCEVVIEPGILKFHEHDTRRTLYAAWHSEMDAMGL